MVVGRQDRNHSREALVRASPGAGEPTAAIFNVDKLQWMTGLYRTLSVEEFARAPCLPERDLPPD